MKIAAETLDILQGEKNVGLGYFCQPFPPWKLNDKLPWTAQQLSIVNL
jgi:hypothetical protein